MKIRNISVFAVAASICLAACTGNGSFSALPDFQEFPLKANDKNSLRHKIASKQVYESVTLNDMESIEGWVPMGNATIGVDKGLKHDGEASLRMSAPALEFAESEGDATQKLHKFKRGMYIDAGATLKFDTARDWSAYNRISVWLYRHDTGTEQQHVVLRVNDEPVRATNRGPRGRATFQGMPKEKWVEYNFEIAHLRRDSVANFSIFWTGIGTPGAVADSVVFSADNIRLERVDAEKYEGWDLAEGTFAYSHVGYLPGTKKTAIYGPSEAENFQLLDSRGRVAYSSKAQHISSGIGEFTVLDFSDFDAEGEYTISYDGHRSRPFPISEDAWVGTMYAAVNFYYCLRVGKDIPGYHAANHQDMFGVRGDVRIPLDCGWYDAGDLSQSFYQTARATLALLRMHEQVLAAGKSGWAPLEEKIREEIGIGVEFLMRNYFGDGYLVNFVHSKHYTDGIADTPDDIYSTATYEPWINFLGVYVLNTYLRQTPDCDAALAENIRKRVDDMWRSCYRDASCWKEATLEEAACGAMAAAGQYARTGDESYRAAAEVFAGLLMRCQQQEFAHELGLAGQYYSSTARKSYYNPPHVSHAPFPLIGVRALCETFPDSPHWMEWYAFAALHSKYFLEAGSAESAPYNMLPAGIYLRDELVAESRTNPYRLTQYDRDGGADKAAMLRKFPIWPNGINRGNTVVLAAESWGLAEAAMLCNSSSAKELATGQVEWILGRNPFCQSLMYGVGYDWSDLYAMCTSNIVGSIAVGIDSQVGDTPFWPTAAYACMKEVWIMSVSHFVGTLACVMAPAKVADGVAVSSRRISDSEVAVTVEGEGRHVVEILSSNTASVSQRFEVELADGSPATFVASLAPVNANIPVVAVSVVDGNKAACREISWAQNAVDSLAFVSAPWTVTEEDGGALIKTARIGMPDGSVQSVSAIYLPRRSFRVRPICLDYGKSMAVSEIGEMSGASYAVNGSYFNIKDKSMSPTTYFRHRGRLVSHTASDELYRTDGIIAFRGRKMLILPISDTARCFRNVVASGPILVRNGKVVTNAGSNWFFSGRHPRTIVGTMKDGTVVLAVIDGRSEGNASGATIAETAYIAHLLGMEDAINLDGGGSSALWSARKGVISHPSDNRRFDHDGERPVPNALIVKRR